MFLPELKGEYLSEMVQIRNFRENYADLVQDLKRCEGRPPSEK